MTEEPVSVAQLKDHLKLSPTATDEDDYLRALGIAARRVIEHRINRTIMGLGEVAGDDLAIVGQAIRMLVGHWYANREAVVTATTVAELPLAVSFLLAPLKSWKER